VNTFTVLITEDVSKNRLLSLVGGNGVPKVGTTKPGGSPDFRSAEDLKANEEVTLTIKDNPIWDIEAGADISAGSFVEVGEGGTIVPSDGAGVGYVAEATKAGDVAYLIRKSGGGTPGPKGDKGDKGDTGAKGATGATGPAGKDGAPTQAEWDALEARVTALEA
jgi:hypothetical protein